MEITVSFQKTKVLRPTLQLLRGAWPFQRVDQETVDLLYAELFETFSTPKFPVPLLD